MPKNINQPGAAVALVDLFDLKGRVRLDMDERVVPIVVVGDVRKQALPGINCMGMVTLGATALENNFSGVNTVAGVDLAVLEIWISATHAAASYEIRLLTTADLATLGIATLQLQSLQSDQPRGGALAGPLPVRAQSFGGSQVGVALGQLLARIIVQPLIPAILRVPAILLGRNVVQVAGLAVVCTLVNVATAVTFICEEQSEG